MKMLRMIQVACLALVATALTSCEPKKAAAPTQEDYEQTLKDAAKSYNKDCPIERADGSIVESVTYRNNTFTIELSIAEGTVIGEHARDSIISSVSPQLAEALVKGESNLVYKYVSPVETKTITIEPDEISSLVDDDDEDTDPDED